MGQPRLRGVRGLRTGGGGRAAPRPRRSRLRADPHAGRVPGSGGSPDAASPRDGRRDGGRDRPGRLGRAWGRPSSLRPRTGRLGPETAAEGTERRVRVLRPRAGGGLGRSPFSQWGLRYPGAHRAPMCPILKAAAGGCWPAIGSTPEPQPLSLGHGRPRQSVCFNSSSSSVPSSALRNVTLL